MLNFDPKKINGYDKLDDQMKKVFKFTTIKFMQAQGHEYQEERRPIKVEYLKKEDALRVDLRDGSWQYFYKNQTWG